MLSRAAALAHRCRRRGVPRARRRAPAVACRTEGCQQTLRPCATELAIPRRRVRNSATDRGSRPARKLLCILGSRDNKTGNQGRQAAVKILVVDDDVGCGATLGNALQQLGHIPVIACHPEDALELLGLDVDAVVTDIDMPAMNGVQLAREIRARRADLPIAFCTGSDPSEGVAAEAAKLGPVYPKAWTLAMLRELVAALGR
ncbi:MAG: response regulator [Deltaproteobacteria bacterium]|nr:MAG: response regulator [Deltaproteobacteria bacterium]